MNWEDFLRCRWLAGLSVIGLASGFAPALRAQETQWLRLNGLPQVSVGLDAEGSTEKTTINGSSSTYDHTFITPLVGLHSTGSIYHPNLLTFDVSGDLGWSWDNATSSGAGVSQSRNQSADLQRYFAEFNLLSAKPYNASAFAAQDHTYRDYGTFNTYTVDATRYGGRVNWTDRAFTLSADVGYRDETATGLSDSSEITETYANFLGLYKRKSGETSLQLHASDMQNTLNFGNRLDTKNWSAGVSDSETFGNRHQISESTGLSYSQSEYSGQQIDTVNASENVQINHRPNLDSYLMMNFNQNELRPITATAVQGTVGIRHQLYESLTSNLDAHGNHQENTGDPGGDSGSGRYGLGLGENYTKRLQTWGRLTLGTGVIVDHQTENSPVGLQTWFDESHQIYQLSSPGYHKEFLTHPRVSNVIEVKAGAYTLPPGDYELVTSGEVTEVRLVNSPSFPTASLMVNGSLAVTITYQSQSLGNSSYNIVSASAQFRLDLWNQVGVYGRLNWLDNDAPPEVLSQTLTDVVGGVDYKHNWFRTGAEYENYDSNFTKYQALRFFQNCDFTLSEASSLSFDLNQTFYHYPDSGDQSQYQFSSRYNVRLPLAILWYVEAGTLMQQVAGTDLFQGMARTGLSWTRGKLSLRVGYEFNTDSTESGGFTEKRVKHRFFTYLRRSF